MSVYRFVYYICIPVCLYIDLYMCGNFHGTKLSRLHNFEDFRGRGPCLFYTLYTVLARLLDYLILYEPSEQLKVERPFPNSGFRS